MKAKKRIIGVFTIVCYLLFMIFAYKGYDKMNNYYNSEYTTTLNENAYVGGDAYNYIINGTYATAFYVLAMGFFIAGTFSGITWLLVSTENDDKVPISTENDELPPL